MHRRQHGDLHRAARRDSRAAPVCRAGPPGLPGQHLSRRRRDQEHTELDSRLPGPPADDGRLRQRGRIHRRGLRHRPRWVARTAEGRPGDALLFPRAARAAHDGTPLHRRRCGVSKESIRHPELRSLERHVRTRPEHGGKRHTSERSEIPRGGSHARSVRRARTRGAPVDTPDLETRAGHRRWPSQQQLGHGRQVETGRLDRLGTAAHRCTQPAQRGERRQAAQAAGERPLRHRGARLQGTTGGRRAADPVPAAVRRGVRAADRLRERRQPDAGALQYPHEGARHPLQPGRGARTAGGPTADRSDGAGGHRRRLRRGHGNGRRAPAGVDRHRRIAARSRVFKWTARYWPSAPL